MSRMIYLAVLLTLLLALAGPAMPAPVPALPLQPQLRALAVEHPEQRTSVIVQKQVADASVEAAVVRMGGSIRTGLSIIHAFAAELPAQALPALAQTPGIKWISLDAPVIKTECTTCTISTKNLVNSYVQTIGASKLWNESPALLQGQRIGVAVIDTGITTQYDFKDTKLGSSRVISAANFIGSSYGLRDQFGHGTHVAGIIGGNGGRSAGAYIGVAPKVNLLGLKVSDNMGLANESDVVSAMQWVYNYRTLYNIKVVNMSLNSTSAESYKNSPLDAAAEILWINKVVVVVAAGNNGASGPGIMYPPANDPFVITVGASDDQGTAALSDDVLAPYSSYGTTEDGFAKPDVVAPGTNLISVLAAKGDDLPSNHPDHIVYYAGNPWYFRMSGTSMAAAVVTGAAALLAQSNPNLTPDQIKARLMNTANPLATSVAGAAGAGEINVYAAVHSTDMSNANTGMQVSPLLQTGSTPITWNSTNWTSANWTSANWTSVNWTSANWTSANWTCLDWSK